MVRSVREVVGLDSILVVGVPFPPEALPSPLAALPSPLSLLTPQAVGVSSRRGVRVEGGRAVRSAG